MVQVTTSESDVNKAPSTPDETQAAAEYKKNLEAEIARESGEEVDAEELPEQEPTEPSDSTTDIEQPEDLSPKELRYKQQLEGERKAAKELQAKLEVLEAQVKEPAPQQQLSPDDQQRLSEKQYLKEQYGLVTREDYDALEKKVQDALDLKMAPIKKEREQKIMDNLYRIYPNVSPEKDPQNEKWNQVLAMTNRFVSASATDPLSDLEERFGWAYEKIYGVKSKVSEAQLRQSSYVGLGGGVSAAKSKTVASEDQYANLSPSARAYKAQLEKSLEEDFKRDEKRR